MRYARIDAAMIASALLMAACSGDTQTVSVDVTAKPAEPAQRPNIIFIMSDDHAVAAIGTYGAVLNETPNIDRLADEGMRFPDHYSGNTVCSPSRAVLMTGQHPGKDEQPSRAYHHRKARFGLDKVVGRGRQTIDQFEHPEARE